MARMYKKNKCLELRVELIEKFSELASQLQSNTKTEHYAKVWNTLLTLRSMSTTEVNKAVEVLANCLKRDQDKGQLSDIKLNTIYDMTFVRFSNSIDRKLNEYFDQVIPPMLDQVDPKEISMNHLNCLLEAMISIKWMDKKVIERIISHYKQKDLLTFENPRYNCDIALRFFELLHLQEG